MDGKGYSRISGGKKGVIVRIILALALAVAMVLVLAPPSRSIALGWTDPELLSAGHGGSRGHIALDPGGKPHAIWEQYRDGAGFWVWYSKKAGIGWTAPEKACPDPAYSPQMVLDSGGNPHVVCTDISSPNQICYTTRTEEGWTPPEHFFAPSSGDNWGPQMVVDGEGNPHVVWIARFDDDATHDEIYYSTKTGEGWTTPENISTSSTDNDSYQIALDSAGNPHVIWSGYDGTAKRAYYSTNTGSGWSIPESLSASSSSYTRQILLDSADNPHVVWSGYDGPAKHVYYSTNTGSGWITPEEVTGGDTWTQMALDPDGNPHVVWAASYCIYYATRTGGEWTTTEVWTRTDGSSPDISQAGGPQIALDSSGNPHVIWSGYEQRGLHGYTYICYSMNTGSGWTTEVITDGDESSSVPHIAVDGKGAPHVDWRGNKGMYYSYKPNGDTYYFAEGCTREGFHTWLTLQNPGDQNIFVHTTYMLFGASPIDETYPVPAGTRCTINVNSEIGTGWDVSVRLWSEDEFYAERPMYFNYKGGAPGYAWDGGHVSTGTAAPARDWYFAEGCTREGFEEWLCVQNPNDKEIDVSVDYITAGAYTQRKNYTAEAKSRISIFVNGDIGPGQDVSTHVHCDDLIVVERPMYFNYQGKWDGGHVVMGVDSPQKVWYFAEGNTRDDFDMWLAVQNANSQDAQLTVRFLKSDGSEQVENYVVGANSRWTFNPGITLGVGVDTAVVVESSLPVVAERPMYFSYGPGWSGGHAVIGASQSSKTWFFSEGCTRAGFEEYICVANPGSDEAHATLTFMLETGDTLTRDVDIAPKQRVTVGVTAIVGSGHDVSTQVVADRPVVAERPMYFSYGPGWTGGHDVVGYVP